MEIGTHNDPACDEFCRCGDPCKGGPLGESEKASIPGWVWDVIGLAFVLLTFHAYLTFG
jgi:hypothetical protein